jgi:hypothetical protein
LYLQLKGLIKIIIGKEKFLNNMYTINMKKAFHSISAPKNFLIDLIDNDHFLTIKLDEKNFINLSHDEKIEAVKYVAQVKKALEMEGAIVLITKGPLK